jgi:hypothetical protein
VDRAWRSQHRELGGLVQVVGVDQGSEDADLVGGLVGVGAAEPGRPVRGEHDEWDAGVGGLEDGGMQVGDGRPRRTDHRGPRTHLGQPESEEAGGPLVDAGVQPDQPRRRGIVRGEGERCVPRTGRDHDLGDARLEQRVQHAAGEAGGGHGSRSFRTSASRASQ